MNTQKNTTVQAEHSSQNSFENKIVLAFSGGLDTSFCVPYLIERGYQITTVFVDSGGISTDEKIAIHQRAIELGAIEHRDISIAQALWRKVITPLIYGGQWYQNQYPLLCSDRYLIVETCLKVCDEIGTNKFAHGCTGMGNDQVRFDMAVSCLGHYQVISPIREIQKESSQVREYEKQYLTEKGFGFSDKVDHYSVNENLMGATISGSEIDEWKAPGDASYVLTAKPQLANKDIETHTFKFTQGVLVEFDGKKLGDTVSAEKVMRTLNTQAGKFAIGRGIYTGDTTIGLKGRIVFEAPALAVLQTAHSALEESVLTKAQNRFKTQVAEKWTELVYEGLFYDPLKTNLEAFLLSSQDKVSGEVTLQFSQGQALAIEVKSEHILKDKSSVYAQSASWTIDEAIGFIKLFGKSSVMAASSTWNAEHGANS